MKRGLIFSSALHLAVFLLFWIGPRPKAFEWERAEAIAVNLAPAFEPPEPEPVVEAPPVEQPKPDPPKQDPPVEEVKQDPEPVKPKTEARPRPQRVFKRFAPAKKDEGPSLEERIRARTSASEETDADAAPEEESEIPRFHPPETSAEVEATDFPYAWYLNLIAGKIRSSWDPPAEHMIAGHSNQVLVRLRIHRDGRITGVRVESHSGTPGLDASAERAVEGAQPFPPLPESYEGDHLDFGVRFTVTGGSP